MTKNTLDIEKSEKLSGHILRSYYKYTKLYEKLNEECGEILMVESMAWRLNQEVLSFEQEAMHCIENLKSIINK